MFYYKKIIVVCLFMISSLGAMQVDASVKPEIKNITIGVIVPIEHQALTDIVDGFRETLKKYDKSIKIVVKNALGDINIQRSIIEQFKYRDVNIMVPIGLSATQMAANLNSSIPIVSLASTFYQEQPVQNNITGISDEISRVKQISLLSEMYPEIKKITLIYSGTEKIIPEVKDAIVEANKRNIKVQRMMIKDLSELYSVSRMIDSNSEAIFILKDNLVVSGIETLVKEAQKRKIPVVTSDEGSIKGGGSFALGVEEKQIGVQGALLAIKIFSGYKIKELPFEEMEKLSIFYNSSACKLQKVNIKKLRKIADNMQYSMLNIDNRH